MYSLEKLLEREKYVIETAKDEYLTRIASNKAIYLNEVYERYSKKVKHLNNYLKDTELSKQRLGFINKRKQELILPTLEKIKEAIDKPDEHNPEQNPAVLAKGICRLEANLSYIEMHVLPYNVK